MSDKQANIKKMLEMQKKFIADERKSGVSAQQYYMEMNDYREEYARLATTVLEQAHAEKKSHR